MMPSSEVKSFMTLISRPFLMSVALCAPVTWAQDAPRPADGAKAGATAEATSDTIDDFIHSRMQNRHIPGVSVAIVRDGKLVRAKG